VRSLTHSSCVRRTIRTTCSWVWVHVCVAVKVKATISWLANSVMCITCTTRFWQDSPLAHARIWVFDSPKVWFSHPVFLQLVYCMTISHLDNIKNWCVESRTTLHTPAVKMTSNEIRIKLGLKVVTIFWIENQKTGESRLGYGRTHQLWTAVNALLYTVKVLIKIGWKCVHLWRFVDTKSFIPFFMDILTLLDYPALLSPVTT